MNEDGQPLHEFRPTRWSLVHSVRAGGEAAEDALEDLCQAYWFPLYGWARRSGASPADAEDLVQGFFGEVVEKGLFGRADARKGRLRTLLLTAFRRFSRDVAERAGAEKRGGNRLVSIDAIAGEEWYLAEAATTAAPEAFFDRQWAITLLEQAVRRLQLEYEARGKADVFTTLRPFLTEGGDAGYGEEAARLAMTVGSVKVAVHRMRERFREALREEVAGMQDDAEDVEEELAYLLRALHEGAEAGSS